MRVSSKLISNQTCDLSSRSIHPHSNLLYEAGNPRTSFLPPSFDRNPISRALTFKSVFPLRLEDTAKLIPGEDPGKSEDDSPFPLTVVSPSLSRMTIGRLREEKKD